MASKPGLLTEWPWHMMGNFKYLLVVPQVVHGLRAASAARGRGEAVDLADLLMLPTLLLRMIHNQLWISLSRFQNARSRHRIIDRGIDFDQVDRERNWDDQILFNGLLYFFGHQLIPRAAHLPMWRLDGLIITFLIHAGPVEFLYYWFHRALHHHFLYSRYHSHHHASIVTEPVTSVIHPFAEHIVYYLLFAIPLLTIVFTGTASIFAFVIYTAFLDFMNNMGHCNFELVPKWLFLAFPPLKYLMYTPSYVACQYIDEIKKKVQDKKQSVERYHSLHHTQFRTNYSLFMPFYDYIYNTIDKSTDDLYESSLKGKVETLDVVHLTHPTTLQSIYHLRLGFASLASKPYKSKWYMMMMWPMSWMSMILTWICGSCFTVERNTMKKLKMQTWAIPRYSFHYTLSWERKAINSLIEKAVLDADKKGVKVLSLGLLNQAEELNRSGEFYLQKFPKLKVRIIDGSSLATAVVLNRIPAGTKQVLLRGNPSKVARAIALALGQKGVQVIMTSKQEYHILKPHMPDAIGSYLALSRNYTPQVWVVGDGLDDQEQMRAPKGTKFIPFSQFPLRKVRKDCTYYSTPAMRIPEEVENMHSCENWLPRKVMSAWRVAGLVHALEGWDAHECGDTMLEPERVWNAALHHGFLPLL